MTETSPDAAQRLAALSGSARRLLDYVAVLPGGPASPHLRHIVRATEGVMIDDLREVVDAGILRTLPGQPDAYDFADDVLRQFVLAEIGLGRPPKLRRRAESARRRVAEGPTG